MWGWSSLGSLRNMPKNLIIFAIFFLNRLIPTFLGTNLSVDLYAVSWWMCGRGLMSNGSGAHVSEGMWCSLGYERWKSWLPPTRCGGPVTILWTPGPTTCFYFFSFIFYKRHAHIFESTLEMWTWNAFIYSTCRMYDVILYSTGLSLKSRDFTERPKEC